MVSKKHQELSCNELLNDMEQSEQLSTQCVDNRNFCKFIQHESIVSNFIL